MAVVELFINCLPAKDMLGNSHYDGDDFVYGVAYFDAESKKRVVYVKVAATKPYTRTIVGDESLEEDVEDDG